MPRLLRRPGRSTHQAGKGISSKVGFGEALTGWQGLMNVPGAMRRTGQGSTLQRWARSAKRKAIFCRPLPWPARTRIT